MLAGSQKITQADYDDLVNAAVTVEVDGVRNPKVPGGTHIHTVKKKIHVPVEREVKVPVTKRQVEQHVEKKVIRGTKMVPVKKYRDVKETVIQTKEEVVHGYKEVWKKVREPTREIVKKSVPVTRTRKVAYVDYVPKHFEKVVEVPQDEVVEKKGYRVDKHIGTKVVEVEEDQVYEMRPVLVKKGDTRVRDRGYEHHGKTKHGKSYWDRAGYHEFDATIRPGSEPPPELRTERFEPPPRGKSAGRRRKKRPDSPAPPH